MALALGKTLGELLTISAYEAKIWKVRNILSPIGELRADLRSGRSTDMIIASRGAKPVGESEYVIERIKDGKGPLERMKEEREQGKDAAPSAKQVASMFGWKTRPLSESE